MTPNPFSHRYMSKIHTARTNPKMTPSCGSRQSCTNLTSPSIGNDSPSGIRSGASFPPAAVGLKTTRDVHRKPRGSYWIRAKGVQRRYDVIYGDRTCYLTPRSPNHVTQTCCNSASPYLGFYPLASIPSCWHICSTRVSWLP